MLSKLIAKRLSKEEQETLIQRLREIVLLRVKPEMLLLFGSASRLEMTDASDLDLVVVMSSPDSLKPAQKALLHCSVLLDWPIDILLIDRETFEHKARMGGVYFLAQQEGRILFQSL